MYKVDSLPFEIRKEENPIKFKTELEKLYWKLALSDLSECEEDSLSTLTPDEYDD